MVASAGLDGAADTGFVSGIFFLFFVHLSVEYILIFPYFQCAIKVHDFIFFLENGQDYRGQGVNF